MNTKNQKTARRVLNLLERAAILTSKITIEKTTEVYLNEEQAAMSVEILDSIAKSCSSTVQLINSQDQARLETKSEKMSKKSQVAERRAEAQRNKIAKSTARIEKLRAALAALESKVVANPK